MLLSIRIVPEPGEPAETDAELQAFDNIMRCFDRAQGVLATDLQQKDVSLLSFGSMTL